MRRNLLSIARGAYHRHHKLQSGILFDDEMNIRSQTQYNSGCYFLFSGFYSFILFIELFRTHNIDELLLLCFINTYRSIDQIDDNYKINGTMGIELSFKRRL